MPAKYYEILEIDQNATYAGIRRAFRRLLLLYHPDRNDAPDSEERTKEIIEAYEVLKEPRSRQAYDRTLAQEERGRRDEADRQRRDDERRRQAEAGRKREEAQRRYREEAERRQREEEERQQREERVRWLEEERRRRHAEERLTAEAERGRQRQPEPEEELTPASPGQNPTAETYEQRAPHRRGPSRLRQTPRTIAVVATGVVLVLLFGALGIANFSRSTAVGSEKAVQPTADVGATITAAVAAAFATVVPTPIQTRTAPPDWVIPPTADPGTIIATVHIPTANAADAVPKTPGMPVLATSAGTAIPEAAPLPATPLANAPTATLEPIAAAIAPGLPRDVHKIKGTDRIFYLKWEVPQYDGGAPITHYEIVIEGPGLEYKSTTSGRGFPHPDIADVPSLARGITYDVSLTACNRSHCGHAVSLQVSPDPIVPTATPSNLADSPGPVRNIRIADSTDDSISLVWDPPTDDGGSAIEEYIETISKQ